MTGEQAITLELVEPDIALLKIDVPGRGANVFSRSVLEELEGHLEALSQRADLAGVIIASGKPGIFIAGADLREFAVFLDASPQEVEALSRRGQDLFARLSQIHAVTVAAIAGACLGGGAELAVWCDRRVLADDAKTQIGFPEVKLGLYPGWGGTARLPRMIGLSHAVELVAGGESLSPAAARRLGLADLVVPPDQLVPRAVDLIRLEQQTGRWRRDRQRWSQPLPMTETELAFLGAMASGYIQQQTKGHYPAPMAALEVMLASASQDLQQACAAEASGFARLFGSPVNRALLNVFFLTDRNKKDRGVDREDVEPQAIGRVGVVGAGIMGSGIAGANARRGRPVLVFDASPEALQRGVKQALEEAAYDREAGGPTPQRLLEAALHINAVPDLAALRGCDLVIEAIIENRNAKKKLFQELEGYVSENTILASNTSTIPITRLAEGLKNPERFVGIHFFNPVRRMQLVEVIRGEKTSDQTVATAVAYVKSLGKYPVVVKDGPGFLVNRVLFPYMNEALELYCEGVPLEEIERAALRFGMPMGPITLYDVVGLDTAMYAGAVLLEAFPDRMVTSPIIPTLVKADRLGQKNGRGFYQYNGSKKGKPDPEVEKLLAPLRRPGPPLSREQITDRLFLPMLLEATRILEEGLVRDPRDVDLGVIFGIGFPAFRGGLLFWADSLGAGQIVQKLQPYQSLGKRMEPTELLLKMAREGTRFYPPDAVKPAPAS